MRVIPYLIAFCLLALASQTLQAQSKAGWFFTPEYSLMLHDDHLGRAVGFQAGVSLFREHLQVGFFYYGRSGPINGQTYEIALLEGQTYRGQSTVPVRADHGAFGLMLAPQLPLGKGWVLDLPLYAGQMGAGFYLFGDDRLTPDGARVSTWENTLMDGRDAAFSWLFEGGLRVKAPLTDHIKAVAGVHYALTPGWDTFVAGSGFYNLPRISLGIQFGSQ